MPRNPADRPATEPRTPEADALFEMILSMDPKDAPHPAVLERKLEAALAEAAQGAAPLTDWERSKLPRHTDDGNGGCIVCREWDGTFGEDDEMPMTIVAWPCAKVRLSEGAAPRAEGLDEYHGPTCVCGQPRDAPVHLGHAFVLPEEDR